MKLYEEIIAKVDLCYIKQKKQTIISLNIKNDQISETFIWKWSKYLNQYPLLNVGHVGEASSFKNLDDFFPWT